MGTSVACGMEGRLDVIAVALPVAAWSHPVYQTSHVSLARLLRGSAGAGRVQVRLRLGSRS